MPLRQVVAGKLNQVVKGAVGNAFSQVKGMIGKGMDTSPSSLLGGKSNFYTKNLQYPLNVEGDPMQGHYILFHINEVKQGKIKSSKHAGNMENIGKSIDSELAGKSFQTGELNEFDQADADIGIADSTNKLARLKKTGSKTSAINSAPVNSMYVQHRPPTKRIQTSIALYMPPNVSVNYTPNYTDVDVGAFSGAIIAGVDLIEKQLTGTLASGEGMTLGKRMFDEFTEMAKKGAYKTMDAVAPGIRALMQVKSGRIISNKMELSFEGVARREFTYTFIFIPKSEQEAKVVEQIIYMFKYHALPEWADSWEVDNQSSPAMSGMHPAIKGKSSKKSVGRSMTIPDTFDIEYMYQGAENNFLNKISTCFCTNVSVQYGGDRYVAYGSTKNMMDQSGNPPQRTTLTLTFKEMEIMTKDRVSQGY
jgi:hypothetical protein